MMLRFYDFLLEAKKQKEQGVGSSQNSSGVLHELLTGYYLNNKKHMEKHEDINGLSPREAHDQLKSSMTPEQYESVRAKAEFAANDLRKTIPGDISRVHWTSKPGDIKRSTGIESTQKEDPSDIMITTKDGKHHGVSLKTSEKTEHVPIANPGIEALHGADHILQQHRENIRKQYPQIGSLTNAAARKLVVRADPNLESNIREENRKTLSLMSEHLSNRLSSLPHDELVHHIRENVLHAHPTPLQNFGHNHIRHTVWGVGDKMKAKSIDPNKHYEEILKTPKHITVQTTGQGVTYYHKGVPFARQNIKFDSQADPMSSVKSATQDVPMETKRPRTAKVDAKYISGEVGGKMFKGPSE